MSENSKIFKINDEFIGQIQNLVSLCLLTGTSIADHMRQMRLKESEEQANTLVLTEEYLKYHEVIVKKLQKEVEEKAAEYLEAVNESKSQN